jgi:transposase
LGTSVSAHGVRRSSAGQAYYRRKLAEGKSPKEALRCLKRRLPDAVYRCLLADQRLPKPALRGSSHDASASTAPVSVAGVVAAGGPASGASWSDG